MNASAVAGSVTALLPLSLLEAVRAQDRPDEVIEDEQFAISLPRRLGLTGVVDNQIRQYETASRSGRMVSMDEFVNLIKLVLKRPDAEAILRDTGHRMAENHFGKVAKSYVRALRLLPKGLMARAFRRSAQKLLKQMAGDAEIEVNGRPPSARIQPNTLAAQEPVGLACSLYGATLQHLAHLYTGSAVEDAHTRCSTNASPACEWTLSGW